VLGRSATAKQNYFRNRVELYSEYSRVLFLTGLASIVFEIFGGIIEFL